MTYYDELTRAMQMLGNDPRAIFLGQAVAVPGTGMFNTLKDVPMQKRLELPVAEEMQMGMSIGLALAGRMPISIYPRWNFLLLATNQIVNHLDKLPLYSQGRYKPRVIIRTASASSVPLHPREQHLGNFAEPFRMMCETINIVDLNATEDIVPEYEKAMHREGSTILVEHVDMYDL